MLGYLETTIGYTCGIGGVSPRVRPVPITCPTAFPLWWERHERFWDDPSARRFWRPPVAQA